MDPIIIQWHGHSCFSLTAQAYTIAFDPYGDTTVPGLSPLDLSANLVLSSHDHFDHNAVQVIRPIPGGTNPFRIQTIETYHDDQQGGLRGINTIHLLQGIGMRIAHFGDLGTALSPAQLDALRNLDVAMIPVGGFFTIGPEEAKALVEQLHPRVVIPMHYRSSLFGFPQLAPLSNFLDLMSGIVHYPGNSISIQADTPRQTAVLTYLG